MMKQTILTYLYHFNHIIDINWLRFIISASSPQRASKPSLSLDKESRHHGGQDEPRPDHHAVGVDLAPRKKTLDNQWHS